MRRTQRLLAHVIPEPVADAGPAVLYERKGAVATITLNRANERNAMTEELLSELQQVARRCAADPEVRCVVVTGHGHNFCGGADMTGNPSLKRTDPGVVAGAHMPGEGSMAMYTPFLTLLEIKVPIVGALQGHAIGGGFGLALCCDIRVAHTGSVYGANFVKLGVHPGMATTYLLPRMVGVPKAMEMLMTGRLISGEEALRVGLCTESADKPEEVLAKAMKLAEEIAGNAPVAVRWTKQSIYRHLDWNPRAAAWDEAQLQSETARMDDFKEGAKALLEKRQPKFTGR
eukprot:gnl/TRDRNA2_/TRDRNA2_194712_c0_seq1.p1 gnl/TRDRNA2_/TRDRNA2_194712_c0~~gnl/TRDRNA2_/TRDRNA2_194712_c0_seq1.p1  ORF type:complete len:300 (-),score=67.25 gnl/TRDRNA2_/TRDRNA2_194712_c0_seq1:69-929(-)